MKREDYIDWETYFMGVAYLSAQRSKDPSTQVGACIVNEENRIVSIGYNGLPSGCNDEDFPWERDGELAKTKYPYVVHAELNAILNTTVNIKGCSIYVTHFPCNECAKAVIQSGIVEIVYASDKHAEMLTTTISRKMLETAGVAMRKIPEFSVEIKRPIDVE